MARNSGVTRGGFCVIKPDILCGSVRFGNHPNIDAAAAAYINPVKLVCDFCL
jgi:hypothetical protein